MSTPLTEVYDFFLSKVTDYSFIKLNEDGDLDDILYNHLRSAIVRFTNCNKVLTVDEITKSFNVDLTLTEKEILSTIMVSSYVSGKILTVKNMEQMLSEREYRNYSQANHLKEMLSLKASIQSDINDLLNSYSLSFGLDGLD
jgi:hypothetical protein